MFIFYFFNVCNNLIHFLVFRLLTATILLLGTHLSVFSAALQPETSGTDPTSDPAQRYATVHNQSSVCPRLWQRATTSGYEFWGGESSTLRGVAPKLCVWVNERPARWRDALATCRRRNGFLVKLENIVELEGGLELVEEIRLRGWF